MSREKRLIENEVIFREVNSNISEFIKENGNDNQPTPYYCECSKPNCVERIDLTPREYSETHKNNKQFVILNGHEFPEVEKVVKKTDKYQVVEKHFEPPKASNLNLALHRISDRV